MQFPTRFQPRPVGTTLGFAVLGTQVKVGLDEYLAKPPASTFWHRPGRSDTFTLHAEVMPPLLSIGDVIGVADGGMLPLAPEGCDWIRVYDPNVSDANKADAAKLYKVQGPPAVPAYVGLPVPSHQGAVAVDARVPPTFPGQDRRWMPFLVDGRNLLKVFSVPVDRAMAAA